MIHKEQYRHLADLAAIERGRYALHIGKIGDETFVYSLLTGNSADFNPDNQIIATVTGDEVKIYEGDAALPILAETNLREFSTGRAIFKKYQVLAKNQSAIIGEGHDYVKMILNAVASKAVNPGKLYQYLELAEHYHKKLSITGADIRLV